MTSFTEIYKDSIAVIVVNRDKPIMTDQLVEQIQSMKCNIPIDIYVIEMGSIRGNFSKYYSFWYEDKPFTGKCNGHIKGLAFANDNGKFYKYYWFMMNDLVYNPKEKNPIKTLYDMMEKNPNIGILSPTEPEGAYPDCRPYTGSDFHNVTTVDYLSLFVSGKFIKDVGFLNPEFKYSWGAIHELAYKAYSTGWTIAYCDKVFMKHLGGTTYGEVVGIPSRKEYQKLAKTFASNYFFETYGPDWDQTFWESVNAISNGIKFNTFYSSKIIFNEELSPSNKASLLHPWFYPVILEDYKVTPGLTSEFSSEYLSSRIKHRSTLLVDEFIKRYNLKGKSILDLACNCGYWSARYTEHGAEHVIGIEGRERYVEQARLYWSVNNFLPYNQYQFIHGNISDDSIWKRIIKEQPFDITICAGILYHIPNYEKLIKQIASVTKDVIIIDTRVGPIEEQSTTEPGDHCFNAIEGNLEKRIPNFEKLINLLNSLSFRPKKLIPNFGPVPGLVEGDNYSNSSRVCILAWRK